MTGLLKCPKLKLPERPHKKSFLHIQTIRCEDLNLSALEFLCSSLIQWVSFIDKIISMSVIKPF